MGTLREQECEACSIDAPSRSEGASFDRTARCLQAVCQRDYPGSTAPGSVSPRRNASMGTEKSSDHPDFEGDIPDRKVIRIEGKPLKYKFQGTEADASEVDNRSVSTSNLPDLTQRNMPVSIDSSDEETNEEIPIPSEITTINTPGKRHILRSILGTTGRNVR